MRTEGTKRTRWKWVRHGIAAAYAIALIASWTWQGFEPLVEMFTASIAEQTSSHVRTSNEQRRINDRVSVLADSLASAPCVESDLGEDVLGSQPRPQFQPQFLPQFQPILSMTQLRPYASSTANEFRDIEVIIAYRHWAVSEIKAHEPIINDPIANEAGTSAEHEAGKRVANGIPIILIHGAPGGSDDWMRLAPLLVQDDRGDPFADGADAQQQHAITRDVYAIDLPGFGYSTMVVPDHSIKAKAGVLRAWMDAKGIARAHLLGWSNGGGVALYLAHDARDKVESLTMLASIGEQRFESSGSYTFEHARYALGLGLLGPGIDFLPHFGYLSTREKRTGWLKSFAESDQRPITGVMKAVGANKTPTLIVHGRDDMLVNLPSAKSGHKRIAGSTLVVLEANHFIPVMQADQAAVVLNAFYAHVEQGNKAPAKDPNASSLPREIGPNMLFDGGEYDTAPQILTGLARIVDVPRASVKQISVWLVIAGLAVLVVRWPAGATAMAVMLVLGLNLDYGVAVVSVMLGLIMHGIIAAVWVRRQMRRETGRVTLRQGRAEPEGRSGHVYQPRFVRKLGLVQPSMIDWARRLDRSPFAEAFRACFVREMRTKAAAGLACAPASATNRAWAIAGYAFGCVVVGAVMVLGTLVAGVLLNINLRGVATDLAAWLDVDHSWTWPIVWYALVIVARVLPMLLTRSGRIRVYAALRRVRHHEFWPGFPFYFILGPIHTLLGFKYGGVLVWSACNPGISAGGGVLGESKSDTFDKLVRDGGTPNAFAEFNQPDFNPGTHVGIWPYALIDSTGSAMERASRALARIEHEPLFGGFPVILKPDAGYRGLGVKLARSPHDVRAYFDDVASPVILQRFHKGPVECSVLWIRKVPETNLNVNQTESSDTHHAPSAYSATNAQQATSGSNHANHYLVGELYSITDKAFHTLTGDGKRTLERLLERHPRTRLQLGVIHERHADQLSRILEKGERLALNVAGNHCQGTVFLDGEHLRTLALEQAIDGVCAAYAGDGIDSVRLDLRAADVESIRLGVGLAIVDVNGTMGESVNAYDPRRSYFWAVGVMWGHWSRMFALGAWRIRNGHKPLTLRTLWALRSYYKTYNGSKVSD